VTDRTLTALFNSRTDAETAQRELTTMGVAPECVQISSQQQGGGAPTYGDDYPFAPHPLSELDELSDGGDGRVNKDNTRRVGIFAKLWDKIPMGDKTAYQEGLGRGEFVVSVTLDETRVDEARRVLDRCGANVRSH
jgi:hypothetical protein